MKGTKFDFYKANLGTKLKLFYEKPSFIFFYISRFSKYNSTKKFDSFIVSYPKSGRTWLQKMIIEAVRLEKSVELDIVDVSLINESIEDFPLLLSTHAGSSWEEKVRDEDEIDFQDLDNYKHGKTVYLYRDPRDILVSQYYHILHRTGYKKFDRDFLIQNKNVGLLKIIRFMNKWAEYTVKNSNLILSISYEGLKEDTFLQMQKIFKQIAFEVSNDNILQAIENCTLEKMRKKESVKSDTPWNHSSGTNNPNAFHSRKGISGEYKTFFNDKEVQYMDDLIKKELNPYYSTYFNHD